MRTAWWALVALQRIAPLWPEAIDQQPDQRDQCGILLWHGHSLDQRLHNAFGEHANQQVWIAGLPNRGLDVRDERSTRVA